MRQRLVSVGLLLSAVVSPAGAAVPARHLEAPETDPHASSGTANPSRATRRDVPFAGKVWEFMGRTLMTDGQLENIPLAGTSFFNPVIGAIHTVAAHPTNTDNLFIGATNGGIWSTNSATSAEPTWIPRSDDFPSQSIGALEFDPTDSSMNTIVAGTGRHASFGRNGGVRGYIYRSTDGGETWTVSNQLITRNISGIVARGQTIVCSVNVADDFTFDEIGIWRGTEGGSSFVQVSVADGSVTGLPGGVCYDLASDPLVPERLYTSTVFSNIVGGTNGVYRSNNTGET